MTTRHAQLKPISELSRPRLQALAAPLFESIRGARLQLRELRYSMLKRQSEKLEEKLAHTKVGAELINDVLAKTLDYRNVANYAAPKERIYAMFYLLARNLCFSAFGSIFVTAVASGNGKIRDHSESAFLLVLGTFTVFTAQYSLIQLRKNSEEILKTVLAFINDKIKVLEEQLAEVNKSLRAMKN